MDGGRMTRAVWSRRLPMATSAVVARIWCVVRLEERMSWVWPPETRRERKGKAGLGVVMLSESCL
jgi:hypothetical protein